MKTENIVNIAMIGCGRISQKHFDAIKSLNANGVALRSVSDLEKSKCEKFTIDGSIKSSSNFTDTGFLNDADLAVILTESGNHYRDAKIALEHGLDVLIEKPVTLKLQDAYELKDIAQKRNRKVYVVKQNRFNLPIIAAKKFIDDGFLGKPQIASVQVRWCRPQEYYDLAAWRGTWHLDGGVIANQASHHIDLLRWFMGPVKSVQAIDRRFGVNIETEDTVVAIIEFISGAIATLEATTSTRPRNIEGSFSVQGSKGAFEVGGFAVNEMRYIETCDSSFYLDPSTINHNINMNTNDVYGGGHKSVYQEIINDRIGKPNHSVLISEAIESLELIHMIYSAIEHNKKVFSDQIPVASSRLGHHGV